MPELPEVETIASALRDGGRDAPSIVGGRISRAEVFWDKTVEEPSVVDFKRRIVGQTVKDVGRRGKYILITLSEDTMLVHLRMSGDLLVGEGDIPLGKYSRLALFMEQGFQLSFNNARKFGRVWLVADPEMVTGNLGPEPFDPRLSALEFHRLLQERKRQLKPLLLDQTFLAGVGNIYADEALNLAKIHPLTQANTLAKKKSAALLDALHEVLQEGIRRNGASIDWVYQGGDFQNHFRVYQRTGEPCLTCGTPISRIVVGQRGTHFCRKCQPSPRSV